MKLAQEFADAGRGIDVVIDLVSLQSRFYKSTQSKRDKSRRVQISEQKKGRDELTNPGRRASF